MAKVKAPKKISKRHEMRQDAVITAYARAEGFYERNRQLVIGAGVALGVVIVLIAAYFIYMNRQDAEARRLLGGIVAYYERGEYSQAVGGTPDRPGLREIADRYGRTNEGNLAKYYLADALFRLGQQDEALHYFERYRKGSDYLGASAYAGMAAIHEDQNDHTRAGDRYRDAARAYDNDVIAPIYLLNAARNYEQAGNFSRARQMYEAIRDEYPESQQAANVDIYLARLDALQQ